MIENKAKINNVLVTGGTGFLGIHLVNKLLQRYDDIRIRTITRNEGEVQKAIAVCNSDRFEPIIADVRDGHLMRDALKGISCVIHLAAMKHVDLCEANPLESISINVVGTINLLSLFDGDTFIGISTDKALEPRGCYGATKLLQEKLILEKARYHPDRRYMVVRSGNILGSSGSVVEKWGREIQQGNEIVATNLKMTRFFIDVHSLVDFIIQIIENGKTGKVYIPFQKAIKLEDLAEAVIELSGDEKTRIKTVGLRQGEKKHEILFLEQEDVITTLVRNSSQYADKMSIDEIKELLKKNSVK